MRFRFGAAVLLAAATSSVAPAAQTKAAQTAQQKMPVSYVCTMPGDEDVVEDKPGNCRKCNMVLQPVRIEQAWACGNNTSIIKENPGKCPVDGRDLVPVTVAHFFACGTGPQSKYFPDAGKCTDGAARVERREIRAHGDHNPVHGGQFFMAADNWHHVEGTYPSIGLVRLFFYDNFKKPLAGKTFNGSLVVVDKSDKELATIPLLPSRDGNTLEAKVPAELATLPLRASAKIKYDPKMAVQPFDFTFSELSKDPSLAKPAATTTNAAPKGPASAGSKPVPPATASKAPTRPAASASAATTTPKPSTPAPVPSPDTQEPLILDSPTNIPPALADALDETKLPTGTPELLAELSKRAGDVEQLVNEGNLSQVWLPATATKTVALVLEARDTTLPERQRIAVSDSVKRVVTAAWELDAYGDLGDRRKITDAYQRLSTAVGDLKAAYGK